MVLRATHSLSAVNAAAHQRDLGIGELFPRERAVLDVYDSVGRSEQPRIMGHLAIGGIE
jgi:hypothetical protein